MYFRNPKLIPLPETSQDFERLCMYIARNHYGPDFYRYGRSGQEQSGIDVYSAYNDGVYLQCKLYKKYTPKLISELKEDFSAALKKCPDLRKFIFAVSIDNDKNIQDVCKELSVNNKRVIPWFWDELQNEIANSKWLLRYCMNIGSGAQWVNDDFVKAEMEKGITNHWSPLRFYSGNEYIAWYGLLQKWDAPRKHYDGIVSAIDKSFDDTYGDMPVAAVVRGAGGTGKSVLLRRLALDLRREYTIYWIADNAGDFLKNEWVYDIEIHSDEKYLLILEDWYRNFTRATDRQSVNYLLQKVRRYPNVRLLIGDRPESNPDYPTINEMIFDLKADENHDLFSYITEIVPDWKGKFNEEDRDLLYKSGFFQALFVYQFLDTKRIHRKAEDYFREIIESDYKHLINNKDNFYRGLAWSLYIVSNLYIDFGIHLSPEALIAIAEDFSKSKRPFSLENDVRLIAENTVIRKYIEVIQVSSRNDAGEENYYRIRFLNDTLADQGWLSLNVDEYDKYERPSTVLRVIKALKAEKTAYDLAALLNLIVKAKSKLLNKDQVLSCCNYLISIKCDSYHYIYVLFSEDMIDINNNERYEYLQKLKGLGKYKTTYWIPVVIWMKKELKGNDYKSTLKMLVDAGTNSGAILNAYFKILDEKELLAISDYYITPEKFNDNLYSYSLPTLLKRLKSYDKICSAALNYLKSEEPEKNFQIFTTCLNIVKANKVAIDIAFNYLNSPEPERRKEIYSTCLKILEDKEIAKVAARKYIKLPKSEISYQIFNTCLNIIKTEEDTKVVARKYIKLPKSQIENEILPTCLKILKDEEIAKDVARKYIKLPKSEISYQIFSTCMNIVKDEEDTKDVARKYIKLPESETTLAIYTTCLSVLKDEEIAKKEAIKILNSPIQKSNARLIYHALFITATAETEELDSLAEAKVKEIFQLKRNCCGAEGKIIHNLYLQTMKVPLFRIEVWQSEVDRILRNKNTINRRLFGSLTHSHIKRPNPLAGMCLLFLRNWNDEFNRPRKHWEYFERSLAHPVIVENSKIKEEIKHLCNRMLNASNCPSNLNNCIKKVVENDTFPLWDPDGKSN